jgi:hypothetical protein
VALQLGATRAAFLAAGVPEDKAAAASEELANYQSQFSGLRDDMRQGFAAVDQKFAAVDQQFAKMRGDINLLRWMAGTNIALTAGVLFRLLTR